MSCRVAVRWSVLETLRRPWVWVAWLILGVAWPAWRLSAPAIEGEFRLHGEDLYELAFVAGLLGALTGLAWLARGRWLLSSLAKGQRFAAEASGVLAAVTLSIAVPLLPATVIGGPLDDTSIDTVLALAVPAIHVAALALLFSRARTPLGLQIALLVAFSWWIPAALSGFEGGLAPLAAALDAPWRLASSGSWVETPSVALVDMAPAGAAMLAAWLLDPRAHVPR